MPDYKTTFLTLTIDTPHTTDVPRPPGNWILVSTTATKSHVIYTWRDHDGPPPLCLQCRNELESNDTKETQLEINDGLLKLIGNRSQQIGLISPLAWRHGQLHCMEALKDLIQYIDALRASGI